MDLNMDFLSNRCPWMNDFFVTDKKQDLLIRGRQPQELREGRGFCIENNVASLEAITAVGLQTHEADYNPLGYSRVGVYLCKHADICLQHALIKHSGSPVMRMIVFKVRRPCWCCAVQDSVLPWRDSAGVNFPPMGAQHSFENCISIVWNIATTSDCCDDTILSQSVFRWFVMSDREVILTGHLVLNLGQAIHIKCTLMLQKIYPLVL